MEQYGNLGQGGLAGKATLALEFGISFLVFLAVLIPVLHSAPNWRTGQEQTRRGLWRLPTKKRWLLLSGVMFVTWFMWWVFLWPGSLTRDSYNQLIQALGLVSYSDAHPIAHTLAIQVILKPALAVTGDISVAISVVTLVQALGFALALALCLELFDKLGAPSWLLTTILVLTVVNPFVGWMSVTLWKDVWLSVFLLIFASCSALTVQRILASKRPGWQLLLLLFASAVGAMLAKRTGVFIVAPTILVVGVFLRGYRLQWGAVGGSALAVYFGIHTALLALLNVAPAVETEAWSLPSQQIARVVNEHEALLSSEQLAGLEHYFPETNLGEVYLPYISNPVKGALDGEALATDRAGFLELWRDLGEEYPRTYAEAALASTYGYWYPDTQYWMVMGLDWTAMVNLDSQARPETRHLAATVPDTRDSATPHKALAANEINWNLRHVPLMKWLLSPGAWAWALLVLSAIALKRRAASGLPVALVAVLVWASCLLSPVYAEARYAFPLLLFVPLFATVAVAGAPRRAVPDHTAVATAERQAELNAQ